MDSSDSEGENLITYEVDGNNNGKFETWVLIASPEKSKQII